MKIYGTYPGVHADVQIAMKIYGTYPGVHADVQFAMKIYGTYPGVHADVQIAIGELVVEDGRGFGRFRPVRTVKPILFISGGREA